MITCFLSMRYTLGSGHKELDTMVAQKIGNRERVRAARQTRLGEDITFRVFNVSPTTCVLCY